MRRSLKGAVTMARSDTKLPNWLAKPKKDLMSLTQVGVGKALIALVFSGSA